MCLKNIKNILEVIYFSIFKYLIILLNFKYLRLKSRRVTTQRSKFYLFPQQLP